MNGRTVIRMDCRAADFPPPPERPYNRIPYTDTPEFRRAVAEGRIGKGEHPTSGIPVRPRELYADERTAPAWNSWHVDYSTFAAGPEAHPDMR